MSLQQLEQQLAFVDRRIYGLIEAHWRADKEPRRFVQIGLLRVYESHDEQVKRFQREAMG